ncbi:ParB N-terminal domain-containing protein [Streptomyces sp. AV19]|uniref:ParB/RepB/Spo0J family partition protein n=1 Tax=Streptomyces sp. AV19 TaxID=2793068 RepID=UPI0018FE900E|nr:ParB N-terminal domain-containing protein [Streptomyces sp. AV19]MBH1933594.1 ParB N-terminal domain-containing protein [Streptomyces sp. AV19]MDG4535931.1 ParB N-terminal domain-containing protein [Streptomyces sp. AV19]
MTLHTAVDADRIHADALLEAPELLHDLPRKTVPIGDLMPSFSPREQREDPAHVRLLAETDAGPDPLLVHRPTMRVIDGMHRLRAAVMRGRTEVPVQFFDGSEADAFVLAVQLNVRHGLPLTLDERRAAAQRIIGSHPHWSDRVIAQRTGLSSKTVGKLRRRSAKDLPETVGSRLGQDGRVRPISTIEGRRSAAALIAADADLSLRELSRRTGLSVGTVRDVRERVSRGQDPVPERLLGERTSSVVVTPAFATAPSPQWTPGAQPEEDVRERPEAPRSRVEALEPRDEARAAAFDPVTAVRKLARDPSLRATESGRWLLRMLLATEMAQPQWGKIAEAIPPHCVPLVRAVVLKRCDDWEKLASMALKDPDGDG